MSDRSVSHRYGMPFWVPTLWSPVMTTMTSGLPAAFLADLAAWMAVTPSGAATPEAGAAPATAVAANSPLATPATSVDWTGLRTTAITGSSQLTV